MGGLLSPTLNDIYVVKMQNEVATPYKTKFYMDDIFNCHQKNVEDILSKGPTIAIQSSSLPLKSVWLNSFRQNQIVLMELTRQWH